MDDVLFGTEEKAKMFDKIAELFYNKNFGQASKTDIETLMFHFYIKKLIESNANKDGTIDYNSYSDYKISRQLGITQQRVRGLKIKSHLLHPIKFDWEKSLATLTHNARYDNKTERITLSIPDPNLFIEIQNYLEENGDYIEKQLNGKLLQIRAEYYIELILHLEPEKTKNEIVKQIKKKIKESNKEISKFDDRRIGKSLIDLAVNVTDIANTITGLISPSNHVGTSLISLLLNKTRL